MAIVASAQAALDVAATAVAARLLRRAIHSEILTQGDIIMQPLPAAQTKWLMVQTVAVLINFLISDSIFMYRCYVIWGFKKKPIILPALLMVSTLGELKLAPRNVYAFLSHFTVVSVLDVARMDSQVGTIILAAITNLVITVLTAGRILWIQRAASHVALGRTIRGRYTRAIVIILESGASYCAVSIFLAISTSLNGEIYSIAAGIGPRMTNILPTLTLVYLGFRNIKETPATDLESPVVFRRPSNQHIPSRSVRLHRRSSWPVVLDIWKEQDKEGP
ncbi:hypothetical protein K438DRAFT_717589 [Mycena galopus ATCC 62051]|nr:hypothetical protein K438DRAFT_717589 [Mycena galopus ATCC 62051]